MELIINGEAQTLPAPLSVAALLEARGLAGKRVAIERNGEIVAKSRHADTLLADGDQIEIVVAVGGG
jgi:sulfur carrier protein